MGRRFLLLSDGRICSSAAFRDAEGARGIAFRQLGVRISTLVLLPLLLVGICICFRR